MLDSKTALIDRYRVHPTDTGSPEVQIALLSGRITDLTDHFRTHRKDHASRRGLLMMVGRRRRLLEYLKGRNPNGYQQLIEKLGIRK
jgi:small subunit ribosomal protein S15